MAFPGRNGDGTSAKDNGAPSATITAKTAMRGIISAMTRRVFELIKRGEDGLIGISDDKQQLCLAIALWNGHDPMLRERLSGWNRRTHNPNHVGKSLV